MERAAMQRRGKYVRTCVGIFWRRFEAPQIQFSASARIILLKTLAQFSSSKFNCKSMNMIWKMAWVRDLKVDFFLSFFQPWRVHGKVFICSMTAERCEENIFPLLIQFHDHVGMYGKADHVPAPWPRDPQSCSPNTGVSAASLVRTLDSLLVHHRLQHHLHSLLYHHHLFFVPENEKWLRQVCVDDGIGRLPGRVWSLDVHGLPS